MYGVIWYIYNKMIFTHIYPITYGVRVCMILPKRVLVHIRDDNDELICLKYVSQSLLHILHISNDNICV